MRRMERETLTALVDGCGRGFTVLCTIADAGLLGALAAVAGPTGLVVAAGETPPHGETWSAVRCDPAASIPLRSHVVDAAVIEESERLADVAEEVRRVLVPGGDVRVWLSGDDDAEAALEAAAIRPLRLTGDVLIARGP